MTSHISSGAFHDAPCCCPLSPPRSHADPRPVGKDPGHMPHCVAGYVIIARLRASRFARCISNWLISYTLINPDSNPNINTCARFLSIHWDTTQETRWSVCLFVCSCEECMHSTVQPYNKCWSTNINRGSPHTGAFLPQSLWASARCWCSTGGPVT